MYEKVSIKVVILYEKVSPQSKRIWGFIMRYYRRGGNGKQITKEMLRIYVPYSGKDWMNYRIVRNDMTAHHIVKKEHGGLLRIDNIALLMNVSHSYLHLIEYKDLETYNAINKIFKYVNKQGYEPTLEQREIIEYLLSEFERAHKDDRNSKGKRLIKEEYLCR